MESSLPNSSACQRPELHSSHLQVALSTLLSSADLRLCISYAQTKQIYLHGIIYSIEGRAKTCPEHLEKTLSTFFFQIKPPLICSKDFLFKRFRRDIRRNRSFCVFARSEVKNNLFLVDFRSIALFLLNFLPLNVRAG
jgi:hypothetical protein